MTALIVTATLFLSLTGISAAENKVEREKKPRFKGVELYSWKDVNGKWTFSLQTGTNKMKSIEGIKNIKTPHLDVKTIHAALSKLAVGEQVFWTHFIKGFEFPPLATQRKVADTARKAKIKLSIGTPPPAKWEAWAQWVDVRCPIGDGHGHGPDTGSD